MKTNDWSLRCLLLLSLLFIGTLGFGQVEDWKLVRQDDGINVFARVSEKSSIKEIRITASTSASMEATMLLLSEVPAYAQWVYKCDTSTLLHMESEKEFYYYVTLNFPFPMENRDLTIHSTHDVDSLGVYRSLSKATREYTTDDDDYVHITEFESTWEITPQPDGQLFIDYFAYSDPGGDIPSWLVNLAIDQGPYRTMKQFIETLEEMRLQSSN